MSRADVGRAAAVLAGIATINVLAQRSRLPGDAIVPLGALAILTAARASGLTTEELGLDPSANRRGAARGALAAAVTVGTLSAASWLPVAQGFRVDTRYPSTSAAARGALVTIPLATAVPEEILFRSVLDAALFRVLSPPAATAAGTAAFGLWHFLGALSLPSDNAGIGDLMADRRGARLASAAGAVLATGVGGLLFSALRRRTDSVAAPIAVHWALNATAALAAGMRWRRTALAD